MKNILALAVLGMVTTLAFSNGNLREPPLDLNLKMAGSSELLAPNALGPPLLNLTKELARLELLPDANLNLELGLTSGNVVGVQTKLGLGSLETDRLLDSDLTLDETYRKHNLDLLEINGLNLELGATLSPNTLSLRGFQL